MCTEVEVLRGAHVIHCDTIQELSDALGGEPVDAGSWPRNACLCPIDIEATAAKFGFVVDTEDDMVIAFREKVQVRLEI